MNKISLFILNFCLLLIAGKSYSQGNYVFSGSEAVSYGPISLSTPGTQTWATYRGASPGYFSLFYPGALFTGYSDAANINGYVKKYGNEAFTFPVGTGTDLRSLAISAPASATEAYATAWIDGNPASTPDPTNANALHNTGSVTGPIMRVMTPGQWDWQAISGTGAGLTVTASMPNLGAFAPKGHLRLVGWKAATNTWVDLSGTPTASGNAEDATVSGTMQSGIDAISIGSIAMGFPDLNPTLDMDAYNFDASQSRDFVVNIFELLNNPTDAVTPVSFVVTKPAGWTITVPGITLSASNQSGVNTTSDVGGGTPNENGNFLFRENAGFIIVTLKTPLVINGNGMAVIGFNATRNAGTTTGTAQNITVTISSGAGGENNAPNNRSTTTISAN